MTKVKICGLSRLADIKLVNGLRPDYVGFVFAKSHRQVNGHVASQLKEQLNPRIVAVGVFVNEQVEVIAQLVAHKVIDMVQLHGHENEDYVQRLQNVVDVPIIKATAVTSAHDVANVQTSVADYLLFDGAKAGSGRGFDWHYLADVQTPYFLAGGLTVENVQLALQLKPFALDVSSGVEVKGIKNVRKIQRFIELVRKG